MWKGCKVPFHERQEAQLTRDEGRIRSPRRGPISRTCVVFDAPTEAVEKLASKSLCGLNLPAYFVVCRKKCLVHGRFPCWRSNECWSERRTGKCLNHAFVSNILARNSNRRKENYRKIALRRRNG